ncbi:MAG: helicase-related protein [Chloroflexota bacterium]|nr:helicase-related protein [Chloroflexota bacterium]
MRIPYVIDNQQHHMADVLNAILSEHAGKSLDIATAYFNVQGFRLLQHGLEKLGSYRLLLGDEPEEGSSIGLRPRAAQQLAAELGAAPFEEETLRAVEDLIAFLRRDLVAVRAYQKGFLHAKCYLFYGDLPAGAADRFQPLVAIVGSSNFTEPGLTTNRELNLSHKTVLSEDELDLSGSRDRPHELDEALGLEARRQLMGAVGARAIGELDRWFARQWADSSDFKQELIDLLDASKFGQKEYTPYQVYMKALFEYFKDDLTSMPPISTRSAVELAEFQEDAVKKARKILASYDGVLIGDSVGLGKTWIGKKLLEDYAYHQRQKALVVCPASLRKMWTDELHSATISATILSQEELGQEGFDPVEYADADIILVDESHNFRNRNIQRYESLERIISAHGGRGRGGSKKKLILMTATPVNNDIFDLYNQISLFTGGDRSYFAGAGIGDLYRYFLLARRSGDGQSSGVTLFNLLEEVVIRRTRAFIRKAYPSAMIRGATIKWPERKLKTLRYNLEATYAGIYDRVVDAIEGLHLAPYQLETYKKAGVKRDEFEQGRQEALAGIFRARYLKRFESSIEAFRISLRRALEFTKTFETYLLDGKLLDSTRFQQAMRYLTREDEEDDGTPASKAEELDATEEAREVLAGLPQLDTAQFDLRRLHEALQNDVDALTDVWHLIRDIKPDKDAKLQVLKDLLAKDLKGQKVIVFTYYKDTARYLYRELTGDEGKEFLQKAGNPSIRRMDSGASPRERVRLIEAFAPRSNNRPALVGSNLEVDVLISTDVLSEGQNLQDCGLLVNYDLHWNPTRMVQRAGRIDRIGSEFPVLWIYNMFPDAGLERLLRLVESLSRKISDIDKTGFLDVSVLGEIVHPRNFNTLRRIMEQDGRVIEEQEQFTELASNEFLLQQLRNLLETGAQKMLEELPDGIHSGLARTGERGLFFYFTAPGSRDGRRRHFWRYYDIQRGRVIDNRFLVANLIACAPDTPRVVGDADVFAIQEKVIEDILRSVQEQQAVEAAPKVLDPLQQTVITLLQRYLSSPAVPRREVREALQRLQSPMTHTALRDLRKSHDQFVKDQDLATFLDAVRRMASPATQSQPQGAEHPLTREDLHLVCFDFVWS